MLSVCVYTDGVLEALGMPEVFCKNEDFLYIVGDSSARMDFIQMFGEGTTLGILGDRLDGGFVENEVTLDLPDNIWLKGDLGYYAKL